MVLRGMFAGCARVRRLPINTTNRLAQVKVMINKMTKSLVLFAFFLSLSLSARANSDSSRLRHDFDPFQAASPGAQSKTVVLDVPGIAERVNEVVVNVRSSAEGGENLGSGFIIDQRGLIATNFHLISNIEPRRGSAQRGGEQKAAPKLVNSVTVTL